MMVSSKLKFSARERRGGKLEIAMGDHFSSSSSRHEVEEEEVLHRDMLYWAFSPDRLDFLQALPDTPSPPVVDVPGPPAVELPPMASLARPPLAEEPTPLMAPESAFTKYTRTADHGLLLADCSSPRPSNSRNIHHRAMQLLRRIPSAIQESGKANERSRGFRHMMRERQRREKLSQSYADLYSIVSSRSKADKNSIIQSAAIYLRELKKTEEELRRRNQELRSRLARNEERTDGAKIRMRVANPSSTIDSMIGALRCLKAMDVKASSIHSTSSSQDLSAVITIETKVATSEVGKAVEGALTEVEKQLRSKLTGSSDFCTNVTWGMCPDR